MGSLYAATVEWQQPGDYPALKQEFMDHEHDTAERFNDVQARLSKLEEASKESATALARIEERSEVIRDVMIGVLVALLALIAERLSERLKRG
jgi:hypothetical protein